MGPFLAYHLKQKSWRDNFFSRKPSPNTHRCHLSSMIWSIPIDVHHREGPPLPTKSFSPLLDLALPHIVHGRALPSFHHGCGVELHTRSWLACDGYCRSFLRNVWSTNVFDPGARLPPESRWRCYPYMSSLLDHFFEVGSATACDLRMHSRVVDRLTSPRFGRQRSSVQTVFVKNTRS
jgi:hypothetical protein